MELKDYKVYTTRNEGAWGYHYEPNPNKDQADIELNDEKVYLKKDADKYIQELKDAQRWRKVSEEKPKKRQMVLARFEDRLAGHYPIDVICWDVSYSRNHDGVVVTHWMPLPKAP